MKKIKRLIGIIFTLSVMMVSCADDEWIEKAPDGEINTIAMHIGQFKFEPKSRVEVNIDPDGVNFNWSADDVVGVLPDSGYQTGFKIPEGKNNGSTAFFTGGGWALKPLTRYMAYYPLIPDLNTDLESIPVNYPWPTVKANNNKSDLSSSPMYMTASATTGDGAGKVDFHFKHLGSLIELNFSVPEGKTVKSVDFVSNVETMFTKTGTYNLRDATPAIKPVESSNSMSVSFEGVTDRDIKAYFMMAPASLTSPLFNNKFEARIVCADDIIIGTIPARIIEAGKAYQLNVIIPQLPDSVRWVDMGGGVLWAVCNLGASDSTEVGDYYAWGELEPKTVFNADDCITYKCPVDNIQGKTQYDVVAAYWGNGARLPSQAQFKELKENCNTKKIDNVGWLFTNKADTTKRILFPVSGMINGNEKKDSTSSYFWFSEPKANDQELSQCFAGDVNSLGEASRYRGLPIRAVKLKSK